MHIGVAYYPEHWDPERWEADAKLMRESGVTVVRLGEGAWSRFEPVEGRFEFAWMDKALDILHANGLRAIMGTPTYAPPTWLTETYPDVLLKDAQLHPRYPGVRMHRCANSPTMRRLAAAIVERMAEHFAEHPAIMGWQIDNELEMTICNCDSCNTRFREWAKARYGDLETLNQTWGTAFWSGEYQEWSYLHSPLGGWPQLNPAFQLDYYRFQNDSINEFKQIQVDLLRKHCPNHFIAHNTWESSLPLDYRTWFETMDIAGADYYPSTGPKVVVDSTYHGAFYLDRVRGIKRKNFWVLEQLTGLPGGCWGPIGRTAQPGVVRACAWQSISRGADGVVFFLWRSPPFGAEQLGAGLIDHSNIPGRRFAEFKTFAGEVRDLAPIIDGTSVCNQVAVLYDQDQHRAWQIQPHTPEPLLYDRMLETFHSALVKLGIGVDVISFKDDVSSYKIVVAPAMFLTDDAAAKSLADYASGGGTVVLSFRTGVKNGNNVCRLSKAPGPLAECAGVTVEEWDAISSETHHVKLEDGRTYKVKQWCDILSPTTAKPIAHYTDDFFAGRAAATVNCFGDGSVYYIGTWLEPGFYADFFTSLLAEHGITVISNLPEGVQVSVRSGEAGDRVFVINLSPESKRVPLGRLYRRALGESAAMDSVDLEPFGVEVLTPCSADEASPG